MTVRNRTIMTLKASSLSNQGYEHSEHPRMRQMYPPHMHPNGVPALDECPDELSLYPKLLAKNIIMTKR